ncbi:high nitrogen upregulated cytochrome P450 monooxygenase 1 [Cristinia sonorae]|uniref:High nitrogen upregulated cytochrome P450 monooxygenase 1 n=1 Tax=Cristinia sonorae TaxID=1940300 RepID=A0A8K0UTT7_9AGAR|nr:high nitrogen upregulated cytochrome P450 monooxygenase 1 [Cristinia sonorae]
MIEASAKGLVFATGVVSYLIYKRFEPSGVIASLMLLVVLPGVVLNTVRGQFPNIILAWTSVYFGYWLVLVSLTIGYRLSPFHPLALFPGPTLCKASKLWMVYKVAQGGSHQYHRALHKRYGDVVRTGPNELSFRHEGAIAPLYKDSKKGPYYDTRQTANVEQLDGIKDLTEYARRRKGWNRGMSMAALKGYEDMLRKVIVELTAALEKRQDEPLNLRLWLIYAAFDFMGEIVFTRNFNSVKTASDVTGMIHGIDDASSQLACIAQIPWTMPFLSFIQKVFGEQGSWKLLQKAATETVRKRVEDGTGKRDLFHYIMDGDDLEQVKPPLEEVASEGGLAIVAGSDTTAVTLSHVFYFLLCHPPCMERLHKEVGSQYPGATDTMSDFARHADMPYLNACVNEAMRLYPAVLTGSQRTINSGQGGAMLGPYYVPDGTNASVNLFSLQRDPRHFYPLPDEFWPDRWLTQDTYRLPTGDVISKEELIHDKSVFLPFATGIRSCVGKNLAILEMRAVLCALIQKFDFSVAPGYDLASWEREVRNIFITACGPLMVNVKSRY